MVLFSCHFLGCEISSWRCCSKTRWDFDSLSIKPSLELLFLNALPRPVSDLAGSDWCELRRAVKDIGSSPFRNRDTSSPADLGLRACLCRESGSGDPGVRGSFSIRFLFRGLPSSAGDDASTSIRSRFELRSSLGPHSCFMAFFFSGDWMIVSASESAFGLKAPFPSPSHPPLLYTPSRPRPRSATESAFV